MSMNELLPSVEELPRSDKLRLMEWLAAQLAKEEGVPLLSSEVEYPVRLPLEAYQAASTLAAYLEAEKAARSWGVLRASLILCAIPRLGSSARCLTSLCSSRLMVCLLLCPRYWIRALQLTYCHTGLA